MARAFSWQLLQPPLEGHWMSEVGRPSDENNGGALLHADRIDIAAPSVAKPNARVKTRFIPNPLQCCFFDLASMPWGAFALPLQAGFAQVSNRLLPRLLTP